MHKVELRTRVALQLHPRDVERAKTGTVACKHNDGLGIRILLDPVPRVVAFLVLQAEHLQTRPRLRERSEIRQGVRHDGAVEIHCEAAHGALREQGADEVGERRAAGACLPRHALRARPLERGEGGTLREEQAEVVRERRGDVVGMFVRLGEGETPELGRVDVREEGANRAKAVAGHFEASESRKRDEQFWGLMGAQPEGEMFEVREGGERAEMLEVD